MLRSFLRNRLKSLLRVISVCLAGLYVGDAAHAADEVPVRRIVVLVHGILSDHSAYDTFEQKIALPGNNNPGLGDVLLIKFDWGFEFGVGSDSVGSRSNSAFGMSDECFVAVAKLKEVVARCRETAGASVPITLLTHSQGTVVSLCALQEGMSVDNWILMGSPLDGDFITNGDENTFLGAAAMNVKGKVVNLWSGSDTIALLKGGIGHEGLPDAIHDIAGKLDQHVIENIIDQKIEGVDHADWPFDNGWWLMKWLDPANGDTDDDWPLPLDDKSGLLDLLKGNGTEKKLPKDVVKGLTDFAEKGTRGSDWKPIFGDADRDRFEFTFTLTPGMMNGIYFDDKDFGEYEVECLTGQVEVQVESAVGSEWNQRIDSFPLAQSQTKSGTYIVADPICDATIFLRVTNKASQFTKVRCKFSALDRSGARIVDIDGAGKPYVRQLTFDEINYIDRRQSYRIPSFVDGEVANTTNNGNASGNPILVYGPSPDLRRKHDTALYLLYPGQETVERWNFSGIYVPKDRTIEGYPATAPYAAVITPDEYAKVSNTDLVGKYDASVFLGRFDIVPRDTDSDATDGDGASWLIPNWTQAQIDKLGRGEDVGDTLSLYKPGLPDPALVLKVDADVSPGKAVQAKVVAAGNKFRVKVYSHHGRKYLATQEVTGNTSFELVAAAARPAAASDKEDYTVEVEHIEGSTKNQEHLGVIAIRDDGGVSKAQVEFVAEGLITYRAEVGAVSNGSSLKLHYPCPSNMTPEKCGSGVTLGAGYDMKLRYPEQVIQELTSAGLSKQDAENLSLAAGLKHAAAKKFAEDNQSFQISRIQRIRLFNLIYGVGSTTTIDKDGKTTVHVEKAFTQRAQFLYEAFTTRKGIPSDRTDWSSLHPAIREIVIDFTYQGTRKEQMVAGMRNSFDELITFITNNSRVQQYESGRHRADYLRKHRNDVTIPPDRKWKIAQESIAFVGKTEMFHQWRGTTVFPGALRIVGPVAVLSGGTPLEPIAQPFRLQFRRRVLLNGLEPWSHWQELTFAAGGQDKRLEAIVHALPSSQYEVRVLVLAESVRDGIKQFHVDSVSTLEFVTDDLHTADLGMLFLDGIGITDRTENKFLRNPEYRIARVTYGDAMSEMIACTYPADDDLSTTRRFRLNSGAPNLPHAEDHGYLIRPRKADFKDGSRFYFAPAISSTAVAGDVQTDKPGFQGPVRFVVERRHLDISTGELTDWKEYRPVGANEPSFRLLVTAGARNQIAAIDDQTLGWNVADFSLCAAQVQQRLRHQGFHANSSGTPAWLAIDGIPGPETKNALVRFRGASNFGETVLPGDSPNPADYFFLSWNGVDAKAKKSKDRIPGGVWGPNWKALDPISEASLKFGTDWLEATLKAPATLTGITFLRCSSELGTEDPHNDPTLPHANGRSADVKWNTDARGVAYLNAIIKARSIGFVGVRRLVVPMGIAAQLDVTGVSPAPTIVESTDFTKESHLEVGPLRPIKPTVPEGGGVALAAAFSSANVGAERADDQVKKVQTRLEELKAALKAALPTTAAAENKPDAVREFVARLSVLRIRAETDTTREEFEAALEKIFDDLTTRVSSAATIEDLVKLGIAEFDPIADDLVLRLPQELRMSVPGDFQVEALGTESATADEIDSKFSLSVDVVLTFGVDGEFRFDLKNDFAPRLVVRSASCAAAVEGAGGAEKSTPFKFGLLQIGTPTISELFYSLAFPLVQPTADADSISLDPGSFSAQAFAEFLNGKLFDPAIGGLEQIGSDYVVAKIVAAAPAERPGDDESGAALIGFGSDVDFEFDVIVSSAAQPPTHRFANYSDAAIQGALTALANGQKPDLFQRVCCLPSDVTKIAENAWYLGANGGDRYLVRYHDQLKEFRLYQGSETEPKMQLKLSPASESHPLVGVARSFKSLLLPAALSEFGTHVERKQREGTEDGRIKKLPLADLSIAEGIGFKEEIAANVLPTVGFLQIIGDETVPPEQFALAPGLPVQLMLRFFIDDAKDPVVVTLSTPLPPQGAENPVLVFIAALNQSLQHELGELAKQQKTSIDFRSQITFGAMPVTHGKNVRFVLNIRRGLAIHEFRLGSGLEMLGFKSAHHTALGTISDSDAAPLDLSFDVVLEETIDSNEITAAVIVEPEDKSLDDRLNTAIGKATSDGATLKLNELLSFKRAPTGAVRLSIDFGKAEAAGIRSIRLRGADLLGFAATTDDLLSERGFGPLTLHSFADVLAAVGDKARARIELIRLKDQQTQIGFGVDGWTLSHEFKYPIGSVQRNSNDYKGLQLSGKVVSDFSATVGGGFSLNTAAVPKTTLQAGDSLDRILPPEQLSTSIKQSMTKLRNAVMNAAPTGKQFPLFIDLTRRLGVAPANDRDAVGSARSHLKAIYLDGVKTFGDVKQRIESGVAAQVGGSRIEVRFVDDKIVLQDTIKAEADWYSPGVSLQRLRVSGRPFYRHFSYENDDAKLKATYKATHNGAVLEDKDVPAYREETKTTRYEAATDLEDKEPVNDINRLVVLLFGLSGTDHAGEGRIDGAKIVAADEIGSRFVIEEVGRIELAVDIDVTVEAGNIDLGLLQLGPNGNGKIGAKFTFDIAGSTFSTTPNASAEVLLQFDAQKTEDNFAGELWCLQAGNELSQAIDKLNETKLKLAWDWKQNVPQIGLPPGLPDLALGGFVDSKTLLRELEKSFGEAKELAKKFSELGQLTVPLRALNLNFGKFNTLEAELTKISKFIAAFDLSTPEPKISHLAQLHDLLKQATKDCKDLEIRFEPSTKSFVFVFSRTIEDGIKRDLSDKLGGVAIVSVGDNGRTEVAGKFTAKFGIGIDLRPQTTGSPTPIKGVFLDCDLTGIAADASVKLPATNGEIALEIIYGPIRHKVVGLKVTGGDASGLWRKTLKFDLPDQDGGGDRRVYDLDSLGMVVIKDHGTFPAMDFDLDWSGVQFPTITVENFDFAVLLQNMGPSWDRVNIQLRSHLERLLGSVKIPVIGNSALQVLDVFEGLSGVFSDDWLTINPNLPKDELKKEIERQFKSALETALADFQGPPDPAGGNQRLTKVKEVTADLDQKRLTAKVWFQKVTTDPGAEGSIGLDGIGLRMSPPPKLGLTTTFTLHGSGGQGEYAVIGFDKDGIFFRKLAIALDAGATLDAGRSYATDIGFLRFETELDQTKTNGAKIKLELPLAGDAVTRIDGLFTNIQAAEPEISAGLNVKWFTSNKIGMLPRFRTSFAFNWSHPNGANSPVEFGEVQMNVADFKVGFLQPLQEKVLNRTKEIRKVISDLDEPLPIISELGGNITPFDLAMLFVDKPDDRQSIEEVRTAVRNLNDMSAQMTAIDTLIAGSDNGWITVGAFKVDAAQALSGSSGEIKPNVEGLESINGPALTRLTKLRHPSLTDQGFEFPALGNPEEESYLHENAGKFFFPIVETISKRNAAGEEVAVSTPQNVIFGLILGKDATLFEYRIPRLRIPFQYQSPFMPIIGPLGCRFGGKVHAEVTAAIGYDTSAIRQHRGVEDGFYLNDRLYPGGLGPDISEATVRMGLFAVGEINVAVARAGVEGGIFGELGLDLNDCCDPKGRYRANDGKIYFEEIGEILGANGNNPLALFNVKATIFAQLRAFFEIGFEALGGFHCILCSSKDFPRIVLYEKQLFGGCEPCAAPPAGGAGVAPPMGALVSLVSFLQAPAAPTDGVATDGKSVVSSGDANIKRIEFRYAEGKIVDGVFIPPLLTEHRYNKLGPNETPLEIRKHWDLKTIANPTGSNPQSKIIFNGAEHDEIIIIEANVPFDLEINGGGGNDTITNDGQGKIAVLNGDDGNDTITGSNNVDDVIGGGANDDTIFGRRGNDWLSGGDGIDTIDGGPGEDHLFGGNGNDKLSGGSGNDWVWGGDHDDVVHGNIGDDFLVGELGKDVLGSEQESGNDVLIAGSLKNDAAELKSDYFSARENPKENIAWDKLIRAVDWINAKRDANGKERLMAKWAQESNDGEVLMGGIGHDFLIDSNGAGVLLGHAGNDWIWGADGEDKIDAGDGDDVAFGNDKSDVIEGSGGQDILVGNEGDDFLFAANKPAHNGAIDRAQFFTPDPNDVGQHEVYGGEVRWSFEPLSETSDGDDLIVGGNGMNLVLAGNGRNIVWTGDGLDLILSCAWRRGSLASDEDSDENKFVWPIERRQLGWKPLGPSGSDVDLQFPPAKVVAGRNTSFQSWIHAAGGSNEIHVGHGENEVWVQGRGILLREIQLITTGNGRDRIATTNNQRKFPTFDLYQDRKPSETPEKIVRESWSLPTGGGSSEPIDWSISQNANHAYMSVIDSGGATDLVMSGDGIDWVRSYTNDGGTERDVVFVEDGINVVDVDDGDNYVEAAAEGTAYNIIIGTHGDDVVRAGGQNDFILTGKGSDIIFGGKGNDIIIAGVEPGCLGNGEHDEDVVHGEDGDDIIIGGAQSDYLSGGAGRDIVVGGVANVHFQNFSADFDFKGFLELGKKCKDEGVGGSERNKFEREYQKLFSEWNERLILPSEIVGQEERQAAIVQRRPYDYPDKVFPKHLWAIDSEPGVNGDGQDRLLGGDGDDWLFGGAEIDYLFGGNGNDYLDGGAGNDEIYGNWPNKAQAEVKAGFTTKRGFLAGEFDDPNTPGSVGHQDLNGKHENDDVLIGGFGNDQLNGGFGIDQLFGNEDDDWLFGDAGIAESIPVAGPPQFSQAGQRLSGGPGTDVLHGYSSAADLKWDIENRRESESVGRLQDGLSHPIGDVLIGGGGGDLLYGSLRRDLLIGDSLDLPAAGNDYLHGDYLADGYKLNLNAGWSGGADFLFGNRGSDQLFGGGGNDQLWGGQDGDWLEGMAGQDKLYGGSGPDILVADVDSRYFFSGEKDINGREIMLPQGIDETDGHFGNIEPGDSVDDAVDILLVQGDATYENRTLSTVYVHDKIVVGDQSATRLRIDYISFENSENSRLQVFDDCVPVKDKPAVAVGPTTELEEKKRRSLDIEWRGSAGAPPHIEQIHVAGLEGDDRIVLDVSDQTIRDATSLFRDDPTGVRPLEIWFSILSGGPGNDMIVGSQGRDQIFGGPGSDSLYGLENDDRLWGDYLDGELEDVDYLFAGAGNDDLVGGVGSNRLYAWSFHPYSESAFPFFDRSKSLSNGSSAEHAEWLKKVFHFLDWQYIVRSRESKRLDVTHTLDPAETLGLKKDFGVFKIPVPGLPGATQFAVSRNGQCKVAEKTGLNRMLGSDSSETKDFLYGGTELDFLYGRGGDDRIVKKDGCLFVPTTSSDPRRQDLWKEYAKETRGALYVPTSDVKDEVEVKYVTDPGAKHYGQHFVSINTAGSVDSRYVLEAFHFRGADGQSLARGDTPTNRERMNSFYDTSALLQSRRADLPVLEEANVRLVSRNSDTLEGSESLFQLGSGRQPSAKSPLASRRITEDIRRRQWDSPRDLLGSLFTMKSPTADLLGDLRSGTVSNSLREEFEEQNNPLSAQATVFAVDETGWTITDVGRTFYVRLTDRRLIVSLDVVDQERMLAIIIDTLGGDDTVRIGETVQTTVWIDAGDGDDFVRIEPQRAYLPDQAERTAVQLNAPLIPDTPFVKHQSDKRRVVTNDEPDFAFDLGTVTNSAAFQNLTIDSGAKAQGGLKSDQADVDWFRFSLEEDFDFRKGDFISLKKTDTHHPSHLMGLIFGKEGTVDKIPSADPFAAQLQAAIKEAEVSADALKDLVLAARLRSCEDDRPKTGRLPAFEDVARWELAESNHVYIVKRLRENKQSELAERWTAVARSLGWPHVYGLRARFERSKLMKAERYGLFSTTLNGFVSRRWKPTGHTRVLTLKCATARSEDRPMRIFMPTESISNESVCWLETAVPMQHA